MTPYQELERLFLQRGLLQEASAVLHWDSAAMMPKGGAEARAEQLAELKLAARAPLLDPKTADLLGAAEDALGGDDEQPGAAWRQANLRAMRRIWRHETAVPDDLAVAASKAGSACEMVWREARTQSDFAAVRPHLETVVGLTRDIAAAMAAALDCAPYDALLDIFEPGARSADIDVVFDQLQKFLPDVLERVLDRQQNAPAPIMPAGPFAIERQRELGLRFMAALGFDFDHGRLDVSDHPFTGGVPSDVRLTTRYRSDDFVSALMGVLHETGHALYEQGLPKSWARQPVGAAGGMTLHESQSLLIEMQVCRGPAFLTYAAPLLSEAFGGAGEAWQVDNLLRLYSRVERSLIRVDADEVSYPLHVMVRYRLEQALLSGDLAVADLPGAWNDGVEAMLGVRPANDREGCLQDIHWMDGAFGYFPTYTLGALAAAQIFAAAEQAMPDLHATIAEGRFQPLLDWLRREIHGRGSLLETDALIKQVTGRPLGVEAFCDHLQKRYLG